MKQQDDTMGQIKLTKDIRGLIPRLDVPISVQEDDLRACPPTILCGSEIAPPPGEGKSSPIRELGLFQFSRSIRSQERGFRGLHIEDYGSRSITRTFQVSVWS